MPREKSMVAHPRYRLEPPDILQIDTLKAVPKSPHVVETFDVFSISVEGGIASDEQPITGAYIVNPEGQIDLGPVYGTVDVAGMTVEEAQLAIDRHLARQLGEPNVSVTLLSTPSIQQLSGQFIIGPDGTINLGVYGKVPVANLTLVEAKLAIEKQLSQKLDEPSVLVNVLAFNSKVYYIVTAGGGYPTPGDSVIRLPITGGETVLDAIANIGGISQLSSTNIWIARPSPSGDADQILPVDWMALTRRGDTTTNYQIFPKDRIFIAVDKRVEADSVIARITQPMNNIFGTVSLASRTLTNVVRFGQRTN